MTRILLGLLTGAGIAYIIAALAEAEKRNGRGRFGW